MQQGGNPLKYLSMPVFGSVWIVPTAELTYKFLPSKYHAHKHAQIEFVFRLFFVLAGVDRSYFVYGAKDVYGWMPFLTY